MAFLVSRGGAGTAPAGGAAVRPQRGCAADPPVPRDAAPRKASFWQSGGGACSPTTQMAALPSLKMAAAHSLGPLSRQGARAARGGALPALLASRRCRKRSRRPRRAGGSERPAGQGRRLPRAGREQVRRGRAAGQGRHLAAGPEPPPPWVQGVRARRCCPRAVASGLRGVRVPGAAAPRWAERQPGRAHRTARVRGAVFARCGCVAGSSCQPQKRSPSVSGAPASCCRSSGRRRG